MATLRVTTPNQQANARSICIELGGGIYGLRTIAIPRRTSWGAPDIIYYFPIGETLPKWWGMHGSGRVSGPNYTDSDHPYLYITAWFKISAKPLGAVCIRFRGAQIIYSERPTIGTGRRRFIYPVDRWFSRLSTSSSGGTPLYTYPAYYNDSYGQQIPVTVYEFGTRVSVLGYRDAAHDPNASLVPSLGTLPLDIILDGTTLSAADVPRAAATASINTRDWPDPNGDGANTGFIFGHGVSASYTGTADVVFSENVGATDGIINGL